MAFEFFCKFSKNYKNRFIEYFCILNVLIKIDNSHCFSLKMWRVHNVSHMWDYSRRCHEKCVEDEPLNSGIIDICINESCTKRRSHSTCKTLVGRVNLVLVSYVEICFNSSPCRQEVGHRPKGGSYYGIRIDVHHSP